MQGVVGFIVIEGERPGPVGLKKAFFRILNFQNKLTPIRGKFEKPKKRRKKRLFFICIVIKSIWILVMILKY